MTPWVTWHYRICYHTNAMDPAQVFREFMNLVQQQDQQQIQRNTTSSNNDTSAQATNTNNLRDRFNRWRNSSLNTPSPTTPSSTSPTPSTSTSERVSSHHYSRGRIKRSQLTTVAMIKVLAILQDQYDVFCLVRRTGGCTRSTQSAASATVTSAASSTVTSPPGSATHSATWDVPPPAVAGPSTTTDSGCHSEYVVPFRLQNIVLKNIYRYVPTTRPQSSMESNKVSDSSQVLIT